MSLSYYHLYADTPYYSRRLYIVYSLYIQEKHRDYNRLSYSRLWKNPLRINRNLHPMLMYDINSVQHGMLELKEYQLHKMGVKLLCPRISFPDF